MEDIHGNTIENIGDWTEGDRCPHCNAVGPKDADSSDCDIYIQYHEYQCSDCGGQWFLKITHEAFKVVN